VLLMQDLSNLLSWEFYIRARLDIYESGKESA
jgi:hypothetical protein